MKAVIVFIVFIVFIVGTLALLKYFNIEEFDHASPAAIQEFKN